MTPPSPHLLRPSSQDVDAASSKPDSVKAAVREAEAQQRRLLAEVEALHLSHSELQQVAEAQADARQQQLQVGMGRLRSEAWHGIDMDLALYRVLGGGKDWRGVLRGSWCDCCHIV